MTSERPQQRPLPAFLTLHRVAPDDVPSHQPAPRPDLPVALPGTQVPRPLFQVQEETSGDPRLLTVLEVAALLKVSRTTVYELLKSGDLVGVKVLGGRRIRHSDLVTYVERLSP